MGNLTTCGTHSGWSSSLCLRVSAEIYVKIVFIVGYGDITIYVNVSRMVFMLAIAWGFLIYSLFIVSMNVLTTLSEEEKVVYEQLVQTEQKIKSMPTAGKLIATFLIFQYR
jgi:hypothetical protein